MSGLWMEFMCYSIIGVKKMYYHDTLKVNPFIEKEANIAVLKFLQDYKAMKHHQDSVFFLQFAAKLIGILFGNTVIKKDNKLMEEGFRLFILGLVRTETEFHAMRRRGQDKTENCNCEDCNLIEKQYQEMDKILG